MQRSTSLDSLDVEQKGFSNGTKFSMFWLKKHQKKFEFKIVLECAVYHCNFTYIITVFRLRTSKLACIIH